MLLRFSLLPDAKGKVWITNVKPLSLSECTSKGPLKKEASNQDIFKSLIKLARDTVALVDPPAYNRQKLIQVSAHQIQTSGVYAAVFILFQVYRQLLLFYFRCIGSCCYCILGVYAAAVIVFSVYTQLVLFYFRCIRSCCYFISYV